MSTSRKTTARGKGRATDSKGNVRVYADLPAKLVKALSILAIQRDMSKKEMLAHLVEEACAGIRTE